MNALFREMRCAAAVAFATVGLLAVVRAAPAEEGPAEKAPAAAFLVRVPLPITGEVDTRVESEIRRFLDNVRRDRAERPTVVLEFWPKNTEDGAGSRFERALALARFLVSDRLSGVRTVAYVPQAAIGHAVLPALACEQLVVTPTARLGRAGEDESAIDQTIRRGYGEIADRRKTIPQAVALGMLDKDLAVHRVNGSRFVLEDELAKLRAQGAVAQVETVSPAGEMAEFTGRELRLEYGFASHMVSDRGELARALNLPARLLEYDPSQGAGWKAIRVDVDGPLTARLALQIKRGITDKLREDDYNFLLVALDSPGGEGSHSLATFLAELDSSRIRTVAFIDGHARADASMIALACDHVVMAESSVLGGPGARAFGKREREDLTHIIHKRLALQRGAAWSPWAAMIDPALAVYEYVQKGTGRRTYFCERELQQQPDPQSWRKSEAEPLCESGSLLELTTPQAIGAGLALEQIDSVGELKDRYGITDELEAIKPNWAHELINGLASSQVAWILLFIGGFALMSEAMSPGVGVGGFLALVCFTLFFWSQFLSGAAGWLEALLFVAGVICVALEIFVLPGFGVFGLGGGALMLVSVTLAMQTFVLPSNDYQFRQVAWSVVPVLALLGGGVVALLIMPRLLPNTPMVGQMVLQPPECDQQAAISPYSALVGQVGEAFTALRPAGKAAFGDEIVSVITEGDLVEPGARVRVTEAHGNRVVVEPADP